MNPFAEVVGLVRTEYARRIRGWKRSVYAGAVGALFLTSAFVFLLLALFLYLAKPLGAPGAALVMAAGLLVIGAIALVIASIRTRRRDLSADVQAVAAVQMEQMKRLSPARADTSTLLSALGVAFLVGLITGRRR